MDPCRSDAERRTGVRRVRRLAGALLAASLSAPVLAQERPPEPAPAVATAPVAPPATGAQAPGAPQRRAITIADAMAIFLRQNLDLVAARYDIDSAEAEKLTARLRPNPEVDVT